MIIMIIIIIKSKTDRNEQMSISYNGVCERLKIKRCSSPEQVISELQGVTCHAGSVIVTCHPTQVNTPPLNPRQTGRYVMCLPGRNRKLSVFLLVWHIRRWFIRQQTALHPSCNRVRCKATWLIETNVLTTTAGYDCRE